MNRSRDIHLFLQTVCPISSEFQQSRCELCRAKKHDGSRCRMRTCRQYPYCWIHLKSKEKLQVKASTIPNAGKGLFYVGKTPFAANKKIVDYSAKQIDDTQRDLDAKYVLKVGERRYLDSEDPSNFVGRYINDPRGSGNNANTRFGRGSRIYDKEDRKTFPIYSTKTIEPGSELFVNYGSTYDL